MKYDPLSWFAVMGMELAPKGTNTNKYRYFVLFHQQFSTKTHTYIHTYIDKFITRNTVKQSSNLRRGKSGMFTC